MFMLRSYCGIMGGVLCFTVFAAYAVEASAFPKGLAEERPSPQGWLEKKVREGHKLATRRVKVDSPEERQWQADAKALIDSILDWDELTRRTLGSNWRKRSPKEQETFKKLLRRLIESSYRSRLRYAVRENLSGKKRDVNIDWLEESIKSDKASLVAKVASDTDSVLLGFKLNWIADRWHVYDVSIDDLSTVRTYRSNFSKVIRTEGFDELIRRLQKKIEDIEAGRADFARPDSISSK